MATALTIHGHFYQPPRENPWTDTVDDESSAHPFHDWNERIYYECYRTNSHARVIDINGRIDRIINNFEHMSFNIGPTLMSWLQRHHPGTYEKILQADRVSLKKRNGHGNAIAQGYNHAILPLCTPRDRITQVRWGLQDFRYRFGREPESLWMPETACNDETLGTLIDHGIKYVIMSPYQVQRVRPLGKEEWTDVSDGSVDPGMAYKYFHRDGSGRSIAIFFYDGPIARAVAFEGALGSAEGLIDRFQLSHGGEGRIAQTATDGESYGHHFHGGERALCYALEVVAPERGFWVTNYGEYLERHPPSCEAEIKAGPNGEGTAWSCSHGVGRWYRDCGCQGGAREGWNQAWRGPLRQSLDYLRDWGAGVYEDMGSDIFKDPWAVRDSYIELLLDPNHSREQFLLQHSGRRLREAQQVEAMSLLEMQRAALLMYTSCGWFFADISGIETVQVMKYAGRVLDFLEDLNVEAPRDRFLEMLAEAKSNLSEMGTGADCFRRFVEPSRVTIEAVAANLAISGLVGEVPTEGEEYGYTYIRREPQKQELGRLTLATDHLVVESILTGKQLDLAVAAMHFGAIDFYCVLKAFPGASRFHRSVERLWSAFRSNSLLSIVRIAQEEFGPEEYGLQHITHEARQRISQIVFGNLVERFSDQYAQLYEGNLRLLEMLQEGGFELPPVLRIAAEFTLGTRLEKEIKRLERASDPETYESARQRALDVAREVHRRNFHIDCTEANRILGDRITNSVRQAVAERTDAAIDAALDAIDLMRKLGLSPNVDRAQEAIFEAIAQTKGPRPPGLLRIGLELGVAHRLLKAAEELPEDKTPDSELSPAEAPVPRRVENPPLIAAKSA